MHRDHCKGRPTASIQSLRLQNSRRPINLLPREMLEEIMFLSIALTHLTPPSASFYEEDRFEEDEGFEGSDEEWADREDVEEETNSEEEVGGEEEEGLSEEEEGRSSLPADTSEAEEEDGESEGLTLEDWRAQAPFRISQVCFLWRQLCLGSSRTWQFLDARANPRITNQLLRRSREGPLSIKAIQKYPFNEETDDRFDTGEDLFTPEATDITREVLMENAHRIASIHLLLSRAYAQALFPRSPMRLTAAREVYVAGRDALPLPFEGHVIAPTLVNSLTFRRISFSWNSPTFGPNLTRLHLESPAIKPSAQEVLQILRQCPRLQSVQLVDFEHHQAHPHDPKASPVSLPQLRLWETDSLFGPVGQAVVKSLVVPWWASLKTTLPLPTDSGELQSVQRALLACLPTPEQEAYDLLEIKEISEEGQVFLVEENGCADFDVAYRTGISWSLVTRPKQCPDGFGVRRLTLRVMKPADEGENYSSWEGDHEARMTNALTEMFSPASVRILDLGITSLFLQPSAAISSILRSPAIKHLIVRGSFPPQAEEEQRNSDWPLLPSLQQLTFHRSMHNLLLSWAGARAARDGRIEQVCWAREGEHPALPFHQTEISVLQRTIGGLEVITKPLQHGHPGRRKAGNPEKRVGPEEKQRVLKEVGLSLDGVREVFEVAGQMREEREETLDKRLEDGGALAVMHPTTKHNPITNNLPAITNVKQQQQAQLPNETWDLIFYHANADAKDPFHLSRHASHRLINRTLGPVAARRFFEEIFLPFDYAQRMVKCMRLMAAKPQLAGLVRDLHMELDFDRFSYNVLKAIAGGFRNMDKLRILHLQVTPYSEAKLRFLWNQASFPHLEQLSYVGDIDQQTHSFIRRHASTLELLNLQGKENGKLSEPGPAFPVLYRILCPRYTLRLILDYGAPSLTSFHAPPGTSMDDMTVMAQWLKEERGAAMTNLEVVVKDFGKRHFPLIAESFPNLQSLSVFCSLDRSVPFIEADLKDSEITSPALSCCKALSQLSIFEWMHLDGYQGDWERGWEFLLQLQHANPNLASVTLPEQTVEPGAVSARESVGFPSAEKKECIPATKGAIG
ncbi:hypothetical protein VNI00_008794 [Paramarasmius palmivorus]|uniref:F-box domain-containing protein n=1 Tax=Paramarasmius palmivorus TaxID=297713 RepID=A0AAW0CTB5_9AGAR